MPLNPHATFSVDSAVELAVVERSGFIESRHIGSAVVLSADGQVVTELGDIAAPVFARSTLKPLQALAAMQAGVPLRGAQVAIACGSHVGSLDHMDVVEGMLKAAGVTEDQLQCPADWPADETARTWLVQTERGKSRLAFNCSGKHAAFLWACTENGWDTHSYLEPNHPLQQRVRSVIEEYCGERIAHLGIEAAAPPWPPSPSPAWPAPTRSWPRPPVTTTPTPGPPPSRPPCWITPGRSRAAARRTPS